MLPLYTTPSASVPEEESEKNNREREDELVLSKTVEIPYGFTGKENGTMTRSGQILLCGLVLFSVAGEGNAKPPKKDPKQAKAHLDRGNAWFKKGVYVRAIAEYNKSIERNPKNTAAYHKRGHAKRILGKQDQAMADFNKVIELDPKDIRAYLSRGNLWSVQGELEKTLSDYSKMIELEPKNPSGFQARGFYWRRLGEYDKAMSDFNKALELDPKHAVTYLDRGLVWKNRGQYDKAMEDFNTGLKLNVKNISARCYRGHIWGIQGKYTKAITELNRTILQYPRYFNPRFMRGWLFYLSGNYAQSETDFLKTCKYETFNSYSAIWLFLARGKGGKDGTKTLKEFTKKGLRKDEQKHLVAIIQMYLGEITPEQCLREALHSNPYMDKERKGRAHYFIGEYWMLKKQPAKARESFKKCLATERKDLYEYDTARVILKKLDGKKKK